MRLAVGSGGTSKIPGRADRKKLTFKNPTGNNRVFWGYESNITANLGDDNCGVPLEAGNVVTFGDADGNQAAPIYFIAAPGAEGTIYYTASA